MAITQLQAKALGLTKSQVRRLNKVMPDIDFDTLFRLENSDQIIPSHLEDKCVGEFCTLHNRSNHVMRSFPQHWRTDRKIMERVCPHGIGHPDPDEYKLTQKYILFTGNTSEGVHGCDGCCSGQYIGDWTFEGELK